MKRLLEAGASIEMKDKVEHQNKLTDDPFHHRQLQQHTHLSTEDSISISFGFQSFSR